MKQLDILEMRRQALLDRCEQQRLDLADRLERVAPGRHFSGWISTLSRLMRGGMSSPLTFWGITLGLTLLLLKPGRLLGRLTWITGALSVIARAPQILRLLGQWREIRAGFGRLRA
jgi:hypothetical protein